MPIFNKKKGPKTMTNNRFVQPLTRLIWQKKKKIISIRNESNDINRMFRYLNGNKNNFRPISLTI